MTPIEHYWPAEMLEQAFPDRFGPGAGQGAAEARRSPAGMARRYTVERIEGGCDVIRLPRRNRGTFGEASGSVR